jgi:hypothetical protein
VAQHTLSTVEILLAIKEAWFLILYSEVDGGEIIFLVSRYGLETGIEDRLVDCVKGRLADIVKGRKGGCVVLLLEGESDNVSRFSRHIRWYEGNLIWSVATEGHFIHLALRSRRGRGRGRGLARLLPTKLQCLLLELFEGLFTIGWRVDRKDHP